MAYGLFVNPDPFGYHLAIHPWLTAGIVSFPPGMGGYFLGWLCALVIFVLAIPIFCLACLFSLMASPPRV